MTRIKSLKTPADTRTHKLTNTSWATHKDEYRSTKRFAVLLVLFYCMKLLIIRKKTTINESQTANCEMNVL